MKRSNKFFSILLILILLCAVFGMSAFATESSDALTVDDITFNFNYTSDSVVTEGLGVQMYSDPISKQSGIEFIPDFGIGYAIYDDPETEIIDGIRINGEEVTSLRIPILEDHSVFEYDVAVRTVYVDTAAGSLAQILDGTFDYSKLLTNPIVLFQIIYWAFMALTGIAGFVIIITNKGRKIKSSDEIAGKVTENVATLENRLVEAVTRVVSEEVLPLARASVKSGKEAVKAIILSNSASKEAPLALLDVFKDSEEIDVEGIVESVRDSILKAREEHLAKRAETAEIIHEIANHTIQEGVENATQTEESKPQKSIF